MSLETDKSNPAPSIFSYLDYRSFLKDHILHLQQKNSKYSLSWIANKAGFKSKALLSMIISGQRKLTEDKARLLSFAFGLSEREEEYLLIIVDLAHTENAERQFELLNRIKAEFREGIFSHIQDQGLEILRNWYLPALRESVMLKNFQNDPAWIARALGISQEEAQMGLILLQEKGFLKNENGKLVRSEPSIRAGDYVEPILMAQYHLQVLQKAFNSMSMPREKRQFESLTIAIPQSLEPEIREKIRKLTREIDMLAEESRNRNDICMLNIQFFSVSPSLDTEKGS
ncbi:MAG: TIGR02147 family protein [Pseudobdellovibrionaceae bacterium]